MEKSISTKITVRVQARDGMFLGPDSFNGAAITIKDVLTQKVLATGFTDNGDSGSRLTTYANTASPSPIITPGNPVPSIYWVSASDNTVKYSVTLELDKPCLLEISAKVPLPKDQEDQSVKVTEWIVPGKNFTIGAGLVLEIPGLWVQPELTTNGLTLRIRAKVTMMCGCEINKEAPWIPEDFEVDATIQSQNESNSFNQKVPLQFEQNSQFIGQLTLPAKGKYHIGISSFQKSTGNTGYAQLVYDVT